MRFNARAFLLDLVRAANASLLPEVPIVMTVMMAMMTAALILVWRCSSIGTCENN